MKNLFISVEEMKKPKSLCTYSCTYWSHV